MGIFENIVAFSCIWWVIFFMGISRGIETNSDSSVHTHKSVPKSFSFAKKFWQTTGITLLLCGILNVLAYKGCFAWILP